MGECVPKNTIRNNQTALRRIHQFAIENTYIAKEACTENLVQSILGTSDEFKRNIRTRGRRLKILRDIFREFAVPYHQERSTDAVYLSTMDGYIRSINRVIMGTGYDNVDMYNNPIFTKTTGGLLAILNNHFPNEQAKGAIVKLHNTLQRCGIIELYEHAICDPSNELEYVNRLILSMAMSWYLTNIYA